jgi:hypothetical protein
MDTNPVNIYEYEDIAKRKMGQRKYDFIAGAATDEITLRRTREEVAQTATGPLWFQRIFSRRTA